MAGATANGGPVHNAPPSDLGGGQGWREKVVMGFFPSCASCTKVDEGAAFRELRSLAPTCIIVCSDTDLQTGSRFSEAVAGGARLMRWTAGSPVPDPDTYGGQYCVVETDGRVTATGVLGGRL